MTLASDYSLSSNDAPDFKQVFSLIRSNLTGLSDAELNHAAVMGLLHELQNQVVLGSNLMVTATSGGTGRLAKSEIFDRSVVYMRLNEVKSGAARTIAETFDQMRSSNKLGGLILDLRFAGGDDYAEAAATADLFMNSDRPILKWADSVRRATVKTNAIELPLILLVNRKTSGSSEALVAALRSADIGLIVGSSTAGHARVFKEFAIGQGQKILIASGSVETGDGQLISDHGLTPDLQVSTSEEAERLYLDNPYRIQTKPGEFAKGNSAGDTAIASSNEPTTSHRMTESGLLKLRNEGLENANEEPAASSTLVTPPVVLDPALARALDVLKGVALVRTRR